MDEERGPKLRGSRRRRHRIQGRAACHPGALKRAAGTRRQGGIWRPVRSVRHPGDLNPPPRQATPPEPGGGGGRELAPRSGQDAPGLGGGSTPSPAGVRTTAGAPASPRASIQRSSWPRGPVPPLFFFRHWLRSSAGAEPGLVGRSAHGLREPSAMK